MLGHGFGLGRADKRAGLNLAMYAAVIDRLKISVVACLLILWPGNGGIQYEKTRHASRDMVFFVLSIPLMMTHEASMTHDVPDGAPCSVIAFPQTCALTQKIVSSVDADAISYGFSRHLDACCR